MNTLIISFIQLDLEEDCFLCHLVPEFSKLKVLCIVPPFEECDSAVSANLEKFKLRKVQTFSILKDVSIIYYKDYSFT